MMQKLLLISAAAALISTGAMAQSTVVTTTGTGHTAAVQIEPEYRTKIRTYVTEHKVRPIESGEKIVVGSPVPREVELEAVPAEWGHSLTKYRYVYSGERVMLVDPSTRTVVQEVE
jgi:sugar (pentulose or hexulose) kinase